MSPVHQVHFRGHTLWIKRDDLLRPLSGNKARKLHHFLQLDWTPYSAVISHGGAQSNAMRALAELAHLKHRPFIYYTRPLPRWLRQTPTGNLRAALDLGMELRETHDLTQLPRPTDALWIPQGIAMPEAALGIHQLATEIQTFATHQHLTDLKIFLPSGTGTTAMYLQQYLDLPVYTTPCIGDADYLRAQFNALSTGTHPQILDTPKKYQFGTPYPEFLTLWQALQKDTGIEFDLLYDPKAWLVLTQHELSPLLYLHCGGCEGNPSMLARYARKL